MAIQLKQESLENEYNEILNGLKQIRSKLGFKNVRLVMNADGSGEIQGFSPEKALAFSKVRGFKNFNELLAVLNEYYFMK